ncbi:MAG: TonB-dependent receptor, partial [Thermoanaerobaculia bacterium]|nr:TonB-dependent receptor [Thermoanaerobaculia bacterium]
SQAAIREFRVIRNTYSAEYSRGGGGTMNAITKSGTNELDGELFFYRRDKEWADKRQINGAEESFDARDADQYGFALGGPIMRDRLFYFVNADIQKIEENFNSIDFRAQSQFNALPADVRTSVVSRLEQLVGHSLDEEFAYGTRKNQDTWLAKMDWNAGNSHHLNVRWNFSDFNNFPSEATGTFSNQGEEFNTVNSYVGQLDSVLTSSLYNFALFQYSLEERPINALTTSFPQVNISGLQSSAVLFGQKDFLPNGTDEEKWELKDTLTWERGAHTLRSGFNYLTVDIANLFVRDLAGDFFFNTPADFLAGRPNRFEQGAGPVAVTAFDFDQYGAFVMDTWRPMPKLTLDFGVRYDFMTMPKPERNIYEATAPDLDNNFQTDGDNFAPRVGFAYDLRGDGNSVVRGGIGKYFTPIPGILLAQPLQQAAGLFNNYTFVCSATVQCPTFPNIFSQEQLNAFSAVGLADITGISSDFESAESVRGSLGYQQRLFESYSFEVEGILAEHTKQQRLVNVNAVPSGLVFGDLIQYRVDTPNKRYPSFANARLHVSDAEATYKAATVGLRKLALQGSKLSWLAHYTWSESIDQDTNSRSTSTSFSYDPYDPKISEGPSDNDVTHKVVASATYQLPWGFMASGIFNWRTGQPYTRNIFFSGGPGSLTGLARIGTNVPVFVDRDGKVIDITQAMGGAANITPAQLATFINDRGGKILGRNTENQPDFMNLDMRISKRFGLPMGMDVELIGEIFNVFNEANKFITTNNQNEFRITQTGTGAATRYVITRSPTFGVENGLDFNSPPRQYQAALKFTF